MKISYDYSELLQEIKEEVEDGIILVTDSIQVLRGKKLPGTDYSPIIDWYYSEEVMEEDLKEYPELKEQYEKDKPFLEKMWIADATAEMMEWDKVL